MALDKKTFKTRAITAMLFAAVMLLGLFAGLWPFLILCSIIMVGAVVEFVRLIHKIHPLHAAPYYLLAIPYIILPMCMLVDMGTLFTLFRNDFLNMLGIGVLYDPLLPCAIIFSIWINDTMAYVVGSMIGKTPFSKISPKKTWEGTGGGAVLCVVLMGLLALVIPAAKAIPVWNWVAIAALCAVFGTLGDLLESKIKRMANVKDSGHFMPGHGGFLDRFDSLLIATPAVWIYIKCFLS